MSDTNRGESQFGQLYDTRTGAKIPFEEYVQNVVPGTAASVIGAAATEVIPKDANSVTVKVFDVEAFAEAYKEEFVRIGGYVDFDLPDTLTSIEVVWSQGSGIGAGDYPEGIANAVSGGSINETARATAQGNVSLVPSLIPHIRENPARRVPKDDYSFYVGLDTSLPKMRARVTRFVVTGQTCTISTSTDFITAAGHGFLNGYEVALTTSGTLPTNAEEDTRYFVANKTTDTFQIALTSGGTPINFTGTQAGTHTVRRVLAAWPRFNAQPLLFVLKGMQVSAQAAAEAHTSLSDTSYASSKGGSTSKDVSLNVQEKEIRATLHGAITLDLSGDPSPVSADVSVVAHVKEFIPTTLPALTETRTVSGADASTTITPTTITATSPTDIPTSGIYVYSVQADSTEYGAAYVTVTLVDFSYFA